METACAGQEGPHTPRVDGQFELAPEGSSD